MGDIDTAVRGAQELEAVLEERFGAEGRGLHEKLSSVEHHIPLPLVKRIRWIASLRNRVVHEGAAIKDVSDFQRAVATSRQDLESIPALASQDRDSVPPPDSRRAPERKRSGAIWVLGAMLASGAVIGVLAGGTSKSPSDLQPLTAQVSSASASTDTPVEEPATPSSVPIDGSLAAKARRASQEGFEAHKDIDELWQTVRRNTRITLGEPDVKDNGDGTSDVLVPVSWELDPRTLLVTLNKYFWDYKHQPIEAGDVDFRDHMGDKAPGIAIKKLWNDSRDEKRPYSEELLGYLTRNRARIRVSAGKYVGTLTFAAGRKCFVSCDDYGHDAFQIQLRNTSDPKTLLDASYRDRDQNPVRIAQIPAAALATMGAPVASVEISLAPQPGF